MYAESMLTRAFPSRAATRASVPGLLASRTSTTLRSPEIRYFFFLRARRAFPASLSSTRIWTVPCPPPVVAARLRMFTPASPSAPATAASWPVRFGSFTVSSVAIWCPPPESGQRDASERRLEGDVAPARQAEATAPFDALPPVHGAPDREEVAQALRALAARLLRLVWGAVRAEVLADAVHAERVLPAHAGSLGGRGPANDQPRYPRNVRSATFALGAPGSGGFAGRASGAGGQSPPNCSARLRQALPDLRLGERAAQLDVPDDAVA